MATTNETEDINIARKRHIDPERQSLFFTEGEHFYQSTKQQFLFFDRPPEQSSAWTIPNCMNHNRIGRLFFGNHHGRSLDNYRYFFSGFNLQLFS
jgi:hypothetical protein